MCRSALLLIVALLVIQSAGAAELVYKQRLLEELVGKVPAILKTFDPETGRFGGGIWICRDQHPMYPLAVVYSTKAEGNAYYHDAKLLEVIVKAGDPLLENMDERGRWEFAKKDGSTWGMIWMPWTYSRWVRTFGLIRDRMPPEARKAWTNALVLGYSGIAGSALRKVHNIPTHHAMGLYAAGKAMDRPEWCRLAADFMIRVVEHQSEGGYWSENAGPVVRYNFVYVDALGTYHAMSDDRRVLRALEKAARFHRHFTYPDGINVETIDQRNPYHAGVAPGNVGFTSSAVGRAYLRQQWSQLGDASLDADLIASLLLYGQEGPVEPPASAEADDAFVLTEGGVARAATIRKGPWFVCLSAYTAPVTKSRWTQDRQNLLSIYHDKTGLILGGGNTKLQPAWSNFTVGDTKLLAHTPGDTDPEFLPKGELYHVPSRATLLQKPEPGLDLTYGGPEVCRVRVLVKDERTLQYRIEATGELRLPVAAHLTLLPRMGKSLETGAGRKVTIGDKPVSLPPEQLAGRLIYAGYRLDLPAVASLHWPALPHDPYRKDGRAEASAGRIEIRIPLDRDHPQQTVTLEVLR